MSIRKFEPSGKSIKKALIDLDLSYLDLAKAVGCSVYYVREICVDTRVAQKMRKAIAEYLGQEYRRMGMSAPKWTIINKEKAA